MKSAADPTILCARKLIETIESDKPNLAKEYFVDKAINEAAFVMERIDKRWPEQAVSEREQTSTAVRNTGGFHRLGYPDPEVVPQCLRKLPGVCLNQP